MKRYVCGAVAITFLFSWLVGCGLKMPGAPIWSIEVNVPFSQRTYRLSELITDSTRLSEENYGIMYGPDGAILQFEYRDTLDYEPIGERMSYAASDISEFENLIGLIVIEAPDPDTSVYSIEDALGEAIVDSQLIVNPFDLPSKIDTLAFNVFDWIKVNQGMLYVTLQNGFPFALEDVRLHFRNFLEDSEIGIVVIPEVSGSGAIVTDSLDLRREMLRSQIELSITGHALGSDNRRIRIRGDEALLITIQIGETEADSARAEIQEQTSTEDDTLNYDDPNLVKEAIIGTGWAYLHIINITPTVLTSVTRFNNIYTPEGDELVQIITLDPGSPENPNARLDSTDLQDYSIRMSIDEQIVPVTSEFTTEDTRVTMYQGSSFQKITKYHGIRGEAWTSKMTFQHFVGILDSIHIGFTEEENHIDLPEGSSDIEFTRDTLLINTENDTGLPMLLNVTVSSYNLAQQTVEYVYVHDVIQPGKGLIKVPDCDRLMTNMPDFIRLTGWARLGARYFPEYRHIITTMVDTVGVGVDVNLRSQLRFVLSRTRFESPLAAISSELDYPIEKAELNVDILNSIPLSGTIYLMAGADTTRMDTLIESFIPHGTIANHRASAVAENIFIELDEAQLNILKQPGVFTKQIINLNSTEGDTVWLYGIDSLAVNVQAKIRYIIDPGNNYGNDDE